MAESSGPGEVCRFELDTRDLAVSSHGYVDIKYGAWFSEMGLERYTTKGKNKDRQIILLTRISLQRPPSLRSLSTSHRAPMGIIDHSDRMASPSTARG